MDKHSASSHGPVRGGGVCIRAARSGRKRTVDFSFYFRFSSNATRRANGTRINSEHRFRAWRGIVDEKRQKPSNYGVDRNGTAKAIRDPCSDFMRRIFFEEAAHLAVNNRAIHALGQHQTHPVLNRVPRPSVGPFDQRQKKKRRGPKMEECLTALLFCAVLLSTALFYCISARSSVK